MKFISLRTWLSHRVDKDQLKHTPDASPSNPSGVRLDAELNKVYVVQLSGHSSRLPSCSSNSTSQQVRKRVQGYSQYSSIEEVVDRAVSTVLASSRDRPNHILALGYRLKSPGVSPLSFGDTLHLHGITCRFPNSVVSFLKRPCWERLHRQIGDELFLHLLVHEVMLLKLGFDDEKRGFHDLSNSEMSDLVNQIGQEQKIASENEQKRTKKRKTQSPAFAQISGTIMATLLSEQAKKASRIKSNRNPRMARPMMMYATRYASRCEVPRQHLLRQGKVKQLAAAIWKRDGQRRFSPTSEQRQIAKLLIHNYGKCPLGTLLNRHCPMRKGTTNVLDMNSSPKEVGKNVLLWIHG